MPPVPAYAGGVGLDARWVVIDGSPPFYEVTKRIHNRLHGFAGDGGPLDEEARRIYAGAAHVSSASSPTHACEGADALVIVTEWKEFRGQDFDTLRAKLKQPLLFDGRNLYEPATARAAGLEYFSIGRP